MSQQGEANNILVRVPRYSAASGMTNHLPNDVKPHLRSRERVLRTKSARLAQSADLSIPEQHQTGCTKYLGRNIVADKVEGESHLYGEAGAYVISVNSRWCARPYISISPDPCVLSNAIRPRCSNSLLDR